MKRKAIKSVACIAMAISLAMSATTGQAASATASAHARAQGALTNHFPEQCTNSNTFVNPKAEQVYTYALELNEMLIQFTKTNLQKLTELSKCSTEKNILQVKNCAQYKVFLLQTFPALLAGYRMDLALATRGRPHRTPDDIWDFNKAFNLKYKSLTNLWGWYKFPIESTPQPLTTKELTRARQEFYRLWQRILGPTISLEKQVSDAQRDAIIAYQFQSQDGEFQQRARALFFEFRRNHLKRALNAIDQAHPLFFIKGTKSSPEELQLTLAKMHEVGSRALQKMEDDADQLNRRLSEIDKFQDQWNVSISGIDGTDSETIGSYILLRGLTEEVLSEKPENCALANSLAQIYIHGSSVEPVANIAISAALNGASLFFVPFRIWIMLSATASVKNLFDQANESDEALNTMMTSVTKENYLLDVDDINEIQRQNTIDWIDSILPGLGTMLPPHYGQ